MKLRMIFALLWLPACASADVYRWTDSQGKIHYGDRAPQSRGDNRVDKVTVSSTPSTPDPQAEEARQQLRQLEEGRQRARAYESLQAAVQQQQNERRAKNCKALMNEIRDEQETAVYYGRDEGGNRVLWTSEQRLAYREKLHNLQQKNCPIAAQ